jgi:hypothetical protein
VAFVSAIVHDIAVRGIAPDRLQPNVPTIGFVVEISPQVLRDGFQRAKLLGIVSPQTLVILDIG